MVGSGRKTAAEVWWQQHYSSGRAHRCDLRRLDGVRQQLIREDGDEDELRRVWQQQARVSRGDEDALEGEVLGDGQRKRGGVRASMSAAHRRAMGQRAMSRGAMDDSAGAGDGVLVATRELFGAWWC